MNIGGDNSAKGPLRVAAVFDVMTHRSHANVILENFLEPYYFDGAVVDPREDFQIVSLCADHPEGHEESGDPVRRKDMSKAVAREYGIRLYDTIAAALCAGGEQLAVDAVLSIGEGGGGDKYGYTELGQPKYPRKRFFDEIVAVFRKSGRAVPVFSDKHLSYSFSKAEVMVEASRRLGFPMLAGSSLPVTWRMPEMEIPYGAEIEEAVVICGSSSLDSSGFHALEALQCLVERRKGGETGIRRVQTLSGDDVWNALEHKRWSPDLMARALSRADLVKGVTLVDARTQDLAAPGVLRSIVPEPQVVLFEYRDGLEATLLLLDGAVGNFTAAVRLDRRDQVLSTKFLLPPEPNVAYSACLAHHIEDMIVTGRPGYPVERTLLVSGLLEAAHDSRADGGRRLRTPQLDVTYTAPRASQYCRN